MKQKTKKLNAHLNMNELAVQFQKNRTEENFELLYYRINDSLKKYIFNILYNFYQNNPEEAEFVLDDILNETWIRVWSKIHQYKPEYSIATWVWRIGRNLCLKKINNQQKYPIFKTDFSDPEVSATIKVDESIADDFIENYDYELEGRSEDEVIAEIFHEGFSGLDDYEQNLLYDVTYNKKSYLELSEEKNQKINTIKTHIFRARKNLKQRCDKIKNQKIKAGLLNLENYDPKN